jgi:hypothetical protein
MNADVTTETSASHMHQYSEVKSCLKLHRAAQGVKRAKSIAEVVVHNKNTISKTNPQQFLIYDNYDTGYKGPNRILVFVSPTGLQVLQESKHWHGDGTFRTASKFFAQLYTLHGFFPETKYDPTKVAVWRKRMVKAVHVLMRRRRIKDYNQVWDALKRAAIANNLVLDPFTIMVDFEKAAISSFKTAWPTVQVKGCAFHFGQSLFKNLTLHGLKDIYMENDCNNAFSKWFKGLFVLAFMPPESVTLIFASLSAEMKNNLYRKCGQNGIDFLKYATSTYFSATATFGQSIWNLYKTKDTRENKQSVNNMIEADNLKMEKACGAAHPNVDKAATLFRKSDYQEGLKYFQAKGPNAKAAQQTNAQIIKDTKFQTIRQLHYDNVIDVLQFHEQTRDVYSFIPKKKYIEHVEDTDNESDIEPELENDTEDESVENHSEYQQDSNSDTEDELLSSDEEPETGSEGLNFSHY